MNDNFFVLVVDIFKNRWPEILEALQQHLFLSVVSIVIAAAISLPLGIFISRRKKLAEPIIGITSIFQTIPSLALFGFLLPLFGIGNVTAIIALTVYALLPLLRNTYTGINGVDQSAVEAGRGMGMTSNQILRMIELPLALPIIMAGLRTAAVLTIGVATLAAFIGAGGLGDLIYRGLSTARNELVLAGAIPAAVLAIVIDLILKRIEIATDPRRGRKVNWKKISLVLIPIAALALFFGLRGGNEEDTIVLGGKRWTEQYILPHILSEYIQDQTDYNVRVQEGLGDTPILTQALRKGDIDMYVDYTGTGLLTIMKESYNPEDSPEDIYNKVKEGYSEEYQLEWMEPLGFQNTYALAVNQETDSEYGAEKISDLSSVSSELQFGGPADFYEREDGFTAFTEAYNLDFSEKRTLDANLMYSAVQEGEVDAIPAFTTDGRIVRFGLKVLEDDRQFFPPYYAAPIIRQETLAKYPELEEVINRLGNQISEEEMAEMNARVDLDKENPREVAIDFLKQKNLID